MGSTVWYLIQLFSFLAAGMVLAKIQIIPQKSEKTIDALLSWALYLLLFSMGVRTGLIDDLPGQAGRLGIMSVGFGAATSLSSIAMVVLAVKITSYIFRKTRTVPVNSMENGNASSWIQRLKEPMKLVGCAAAGIILSLLTPWFHWFDERVTTVLLFILLFLVGVQMVQGKADMLIVIRQPISVILPLLTVAGSLLGGWGLGSILSLTSGEALAISAGFGWYSLSGVLIAEMGNPVLGSVAFLSNLIREIIACVTIPILAGFKQPHAAISVGGATSMDVTLPLVEHSCGPEYVPLSLAHGILLTIAVPFLVPMLFVL